MKISIKLQQKISAVNLNLFIACVFCFMIGGSLVKNSWVLAGLTYAVIAIGSYLNKKTLTSP